MIAIGHGWSLAIFPLAASVIAFAFAAILGAGVARRLRAHELMWMVALLMYALASLAMFLGVLRGWQPAPFRLYWLLGAILNVPFLLQGEAYLLVRRRGVAHGLLLALLALSIYAAQQVWSAPLHLAALRSSLPLGKDAFGDHSTPYRLAQLYALPAYFLLLGGLVWSVLQMKGRPELTDRTAGTVAIAAGATIVAVGSGIGAGFHVVPLFSASLAAGVAVMFVGFLRVSGVRPPRPGRARSGGRGT